MDIVNDAWALGAIIVAILVALTFGGWRAGWFSGPRNDAGNLQAQGREAERGQSGPGGPPF